MRKLIKKYYKGGYTVSTKENSYYSPEELLNAVDEGYNFVTNWYNQRKATGKFDDLLTDEEMLFLKDKSANTRVRFSNIGDKGGNASSIINPNTNKPFGVMRLNPENTKSTWGIDWYNDKNLVTNAVHEWTHLLNNKLVAPGMSVDLAKVSPAIHKVAEITNTPLLRMTGKSYLNNANEIYSRLMEMRYAMKANPNLTYTLDDLKSYLKKFALPADETGVRLMNEVADNSLNTPKEYMPGLMSISKNGSKLIRKNASFKK